MPGARPRRDSARTRSRSPSSRTRSAPSSRRRDRGCSPCRPKPLSDQEINFARKEIAWIECRSVGSPASLCAFDRPSWTLLTSRTSRAGVVAPDWLMRRRPPAPRRRSRPHPRVGVVRSARQADPDAGRADRREGARPPDRRTLADEADRPSAQHDSPGARRQNSPRSASDSASLKSWVTNRTSGAAGATAREALHAGATRAVRRARRRVRPSAAAPASR